MRKIFISISVSAFLYADISSFANNAIIELDRPTSMQTRDRVILHGGGYTMRTPNSTYYPFNVQPPSIKAGCGGIDMTFGSLSFLDGDQMVAFAQNILSAAPGVAFDLALKTLCPSCSDTLKSLQAMANQINAIGSSSCQAAQGLVSMGASAMGIQPEINSIGGLTGQNGGSSSQDSWLKTFNESYLKTGTQILSDFNNALNAKGCTGDSCKHLRFFTQTDTDSFVFWMLMNQGSDFSDYTDAFRAMIGDITLIRPTGEANGELNWVPSIDGIETGRYMYNGIERSAFTQGNTELLIKRIIGTYAGEAKVRLTDETMINATFPVGNLVDNFKTKIESIIVKIETRTSPTPDDVAFLNLFRDPVYRMFNMYASIPGGADILRVNKEPLAVMLASEFVYHFIMEINKMAVNAYSKLESAESKMVTAPYVNTQKSIEWSKEMSRNAQRSVGIAYDIYRDNYIKYNEAVSGYADKLKKIRELRAFTLARTSPDLFANYVYGKGLGGK